MVLFHLLQPAGWKLGLLRIEDVAIGALVSVVVGVLFWPRGAASVVGDDLADSFRDGAAYLTQAVDWALGPRQGAKKLPKEDLWLLVMAAMRLRLTAFSLAGLRAPESMMHRPSTAGIRTAGIRTWSESSPNPITRTCCGVHEHLQHLSSHAQAIAEPAAHVAEQRRVPWWR